MLTERAVPMDECVKRWKTEKHGFRTAIKNSIQNPYFWNNTLYFCYVWIILDIDLNYELYASPEVNSVNSRYLAANIIHLINAVAYVGCWLYEGWPIFHVVMIPEVMNMIEASLYIASSTLYPKIGETPSYWDYPDNDTAIFYNDPVTQQVQDIELAAAVIALATCFGWCITWWMSYPRYPGRGITFDDPDFTALITIVLAAAMYLAYASQIIEDRSTYGENYFYVLADYVYVFNGFLYLIAALRDCGWFYWGPVGGIWRFYFKFEWRVGNPAINSDRELKTDSEPINNPPKNEENEDNEDDEDNEGNDDEEEMSSEEKKKGKK